MKRRRTIGWLLATTALVLGLALAWSGSACAEEQAAPVATIEQVREAEPDWKALYYAALERIVEYEDTLEQALELAQGYRQDWEEQRALTEAQKSRADQTLEIVKSLIATVEELKDLVNKQHEIIMKLTSPKRVSLEADARMNAAWENGALAFRPTVGLAIKLALF